MSYNPTRAKNQTRANIRRKPIPTGGLTHSKIIRGNGLQEPLSTIGDKITLPHGFSQFIFQGSTFDVRYELVYAGNGSQFGDSDGERCIRVLNGTLFVTVENANGVKQLQTLQKGASISFAKGVKYSYSSSTSECELYITETKDYKWSELVPATSSSKIIPPTPIRAAVRSTDPIRQEALKKAQEISASKKKGRPKKEKGPKLNEGFATLGDNPKPMGAGAFENDD